MCVPVASGSGAGISLASVPIPTKHPKKTKDPKKLRVGGGKVWEDSSLDEWDPSKNNVQLVTLEPLCWDFPQIGPFLCYANA